MRVLWVKGGGLVPPDVGQRIRSYNLLRELAKRHRVTLFTFYGAHANDEHSALERMCERVVTVPLDIPARRSSREYFKFMQQLLSPVPYSISKYCLPEVARSLRELTSSETYDVLVCDFILPARLIPWSLPCPKVIFTHNVETQIWKRHVEVTKNPFWKLVAWREYRTMKNYEKWYLPLADHVLAVSAIDRKSLSKWVDSNKVTVMPTGVDVEYFSPSKDEVEPNSLVFSGAMDWIPNQEGVLYFMKRILPLIRNEIPGTTLTIVGRNPSDKLQNVARECGVKVTGRVDDIRPFVRNAAVYVVPLRVGSGTRLKIFEAMAMGKAIVSTTLGAEGLPVIDGQNILLADTPEEFGRKVIELLRNPDERSHLGAAARHLVAQHHSWATVSQHFDEVFAKLCGTRDATQHPAADWVQMRPM